MPLWVRNTLKIIRGDCSLSLCTFALTKYDTWPLQWQTSVFFWQNMITATHKWRWLLCAIWRVKTYPILCCYMWGPPSPPPRHNRFISQSYNHKLYRAGVHNSNICLILNYILCQSVPESAMRIWRTDKTLFKKLHTYISVNKQRQARKADKNLLFMSFELLFNWIPFLKFHCAKSQNQRCR